MTLSPDTIGRIVERAHAEMCAEYLRINGREFLLTRTYHHGYQRGMARRVERTVQQYLQLDDDSLRRPVTTVRVCYLKGVGHLVAVMFRERYQKDSQRVEVLVQKDAETAMERGTRIHQEVEAKVDGWTSAFTGFGPLPMIDKATGPELDEQAAIRGVARTEQPHIRFLRQLDEQAEKVEGVTLAELVITLCDAQREVPHQMKKWAAFSPAQKDAARAEWSRQVKRDVRAKEEAERKDRELSVDDDRWEA